MFTTPHWPRPYLVLSLDCADTLHWLDAVMPGQSGTLWRARLLAVDEQEPLSFETETRLQLGEALWRWQSGWEGEACPADTHPDSDQSPPLALLCRPAGKHCCRAHIPQRNNIYCPSKEVGKAVSSVTTERKRGFTVLLLIGSINAEFCHHGRIGRRCRMRIDGSLHFPL